MTETRVLKGGPEAPRQRSANCRHKYQRGIRDSAAPCPECDNGGNTPPNERRTFEQARRILTRTAK
jgi:hypothetical protein